MKRTPKLGAFLAARRGRLERGDVSLRRIFRYARRGLEQMVVYVELGELTPNDEVEVRIELLDAADDELWEAIETRERVRHRHKEWLFHIDGPALPGGSATLNLYVNDTLTDVRVLHME